LRRKHHVGGPDVEKFEDNIKMNFRETGCPQCGLDLPKSIAASCCKHENETSVHFKSEAILTS